MQRVDRRNNEPLRRFPPSSLDLLSRICEPASRGLANRARQCDIAYIITLMPTAYESMENCRK